MSEADMRLLMHEDRSVVAFPVFSGEDDITHPTEGVDVPIRYDDLAAILFPDTFPVVDDAKDRQDRNDYP